MCVACASIPFRTADKSSELIRKPLQPRQHRQPHEHGQPQGTGGQEEEEEELGENAGIELRLIDRNFYRVTKPTESFPHVFMILLLSNTLVSPTCRHPFLISGV